MSSIVTITLNPAIDKSTTVPAMIPDKKLRCSVPVFEPGGGGINVARALHKLGHEVAAMYFAGSYSGVFLQELLQKEGVASVVIPIDQHTRENLVVTDRSTEVQYRFGMPGPVIKEQEYNTLIEKIAALQNVDYIVASGSISPGIPSSVFARLAVIARKTGARLVLDTAGEPLRLAVEEGLFLIKPNINEFCSLVNCEEPDMATIERSAKKLIATGKCRVILISRGPAGALLVSANGVWQIAAPVVKQKSTVGAGDSMLAGVIAALSCGKDLYHAAMYGVACGTAATMNMGTQLCKPEDVSRLYKEMQGNDK